MDGAKSFTDRPRTRRGRPGHSSSPPSPRGRPISAPPARPDPGSPTTKRNRLRTESNSNIRWSPRGGGGGGAVGDSRRRNDSRDSRSSSRRGAPYSGSSSLSPSSSRKTAATGTSQMRARSQTSDKVLVTKSQRLRGGTPRAGDAGAGGGSGYSARTGNKVKKPPQRRIPGTSGSGSDSSIKSQPPSSTKTRGSKSK
mmetsp:Transcript_11999/g.34643  ORF Transcript_11999/g.34643 Transcript_11999/m.34643 type:complete len:197 (+) Transcript_11999:2810-3400(+)